MDRYDFKLVEWDLTLRCADGDLYFSKYILMMVSDVAKKMLASGMKESKDSMITLGESKTDIREMLYIIDFPSTWPKDENKTFTVTNPLVLMAFAHRWDITILYDTIENIILSRCSSKDISAIRMCYPRLADDLVCRCIVRREYKYISKTDMDHNIPRLIKNEDLDIKDVVRPYREHNYSIDKDIIDQINGRLVANPSEIIDALDIFEDDELSQNIKIMIRALFTLIIKYNDNSRALAETLEIYMHQDMHPSIVEPYTKILHTLTDRKKAAVKGKPVAKGKPRLDNNEVAKYASTIRHEDA